MGIGNFLPSLNNNCWEMVYVEYPETYDDDDFVIWYEDLMETIHGILPPSFYEPCSELKRRSGMEIVATNHLLDVCLADNEWSLAVIIAAKENDRYEINPLAGHHLELLEKRLFNGLHKNGFHLRLRTGPWTTTSFDPID